MITREVRTLRLKGIVRPADIGPYNTVQSQFLADLHIAIHNRAIQGAQGTIGHDEIIECSSQETGASCVRSMRDRRTSDEAGAGDKKSHERLVHVPCPSEYIYPTPYENA